MDGHLTSLSRIFGSATSTERAARFAEFVGQIIKDVQAAIQSHKEWWLSDGETLPPDIKEAALLLCVEHFSKVRELERRISKDTRRLGITEVTWPPYLAANVHPLVQNQSRKYSEFADSAAFPNNSSDAVMTSDAVKACLEQLSRAFQNPEVHSATAATKDLEHESASSVAPPPIRPLPSGTEILLLFRRLVNHLTSPQLSYEDAEDCVSSRICMAIEENANPDRRPIENFSAYVTHGVAAFDRNDHWRELQRIQNGLAQLQVFYTEPTTAAPEYEVIGRELRSLLLDYADQLPERDREIFVAIACDKFEPQQICEKLFHRLGLLETSRNVSQLRKDRRIHLEAMLTKHGYEVPPHSRASSSDSN